jgi:hypothetical protein
MSFENLPYDVLEAKVQTIVCHYLDTMRRDMHFISMVLDGGRLPQDVVDTLRPIVTKLLTATSGTLVVVTQADADLLDIYHDDVLRMSEERRNIADVLKRTVITSPFLEIEQALAAEFKLKLLPMNERGLDICSREIDGSSFSIDDIIVVASTQCDHLMEFSRQWHAAPDLGEEWNPEEGNQQEDSKDRQVIGMAQGFLIGYALWFLYASRKPEALLGYLKRRRIPHGVKVAEDIVRIYESTGKGDSKSTKKRR